ncbi:MAG: acyl-CoA thioesterase [Isosphaeraceae bacterium]
MEIEQTARPAVLSRAGLSIVIMPDQANHYGTMHGGVLLRLADECGAIAALRHVGRGQITTAAMDSMTFLGPVYVGERVEMFAEVTYAGRTSIESRIDVYAEPFGRAEPRKVGVGYCLYVALDEQDLRPLRVPPLFSETEADHRRDQAAAARQEIRQARRREAQAEQAQAEQTGKS